MDDAYRKISFREAHELLEKEPEICFFDVREEEEYEAGHAAGAELYPLGTIDGESAAERIPDFDTPVHVRRKKTSFRKRSEGTSFCLPGRCRQIWYLSQYSL